MPQETIVPDRLAEQQREETRKWLESVKDAPPIAPEQQHYTFENGKPYTKLGKSEGASFIPDQGFDGPA